MNCGRWVVGLKDGFWQGRVTGRMFTFQDVTNGLRIGVIGGDGITQLENSTFALFVAPWTRALRPDYCLCI